MPLYRARLRSCPACAAQMQQVPTRHSRRAEGVDLCERCGGAFMEFFAGEPTALSGDLERHVRAFADVERPRGDRPLTCPDCARVMDAHPYLDFGPDVARCSRCYAVFATAAQVRELARLRFPELESTWLERIAAWFRRLTARLLGRAAV